MAKKTADSSPPVCFALTVPGLEKITAREIEEKLGGIVKKTLSGIVVFRPDTMDRSILELKTAEDVFLLAFGSDQLTFRAGDLEQLSKWTAREANWPRLIEIHRQIRPKPKGKPSYHLVAQMHGEHGYRRTDILEALEKGLQRKLPAHLVKVHVDAYLEIWLRVMGKRAICGIRLSDQTMRHRTYKSEQVLASLRPVVAAAMLQVSETEYSGWTMDPCCGAGTILAEQFLTNREAQVLGGDFDKNALVASWGNLRRWREHPPLARWDARRLPLANGSISRIVTNPPFGKQLGKPEEIGMLYQQFVREWQRVLRPGGLAVVLASDVEALEKAAWKQGWQQEGMYRIRLLGYPAAISVWRTPMTTTW